MRSTALPLLLAAMSTALAALGLSAVLRAPPSAASAAGGPRLETVVGSGASGFAGDNGTASAGDLDSPTGIAVDRAGDLFVADTGNCRVRMVPARDEVSFGVHMVAHRLYTVAGAPCGASRSAAGVGFPTGVAVDRAGDLFVAASSENRVFEIRATRGGGSPPRPKAMVGTGVAGFNGDGQAASTAELDHPGGIAVDGAGDLFVADTGNCRVRMVPAQGGVYFGTAMVAGDVYTIAGTGTCGAGGSGGPAAAAQLGAPTAVAVDADGNVVVADRGNNSISEVAAVAGTYYGVPIAQGAIATVAGTGTYGPYAGDGLSASGPLSAVDYPYGLAVDGSGDLFFSDTYERAVREVPATTGKLFGRSVSAGNLYTLAGLLPVSTPTGAGDGTKWILGRVGYPYGVAVGPSGRLYFSDQGANVVREVA